MWSKVPCLRAQQAIYFLLETCTEFFFHIITLSTQFRFFFTSTLTGALSKYYLNNKVIVVFLIQLPVMKCFFHLTFSRSFLFILGYTRHDSGKFVTVAEYTPSMGHHPDGWVFGGSQWLSNFDVIHILV